MLNICFLQFSKSPKTPVQLDHDYLYTSSTSGDEMVFKKPVISCFAGVFCLLCKSYGCYNNKIHFQIERLTIKDALITDDISSSSPLK